MRQQPLKSSSPATQRSGFTLTEMLVVCGLIVLIILLALPAFRAITGGRSMEAAGNQISALLGRARAEAIGLQEVAGVMFFVNPRNDRITAALVREVQPQAAGSPTAKLIYLDRIPDRDFIAIPMGVDLQVLDESGISATRTDNGYIGYNAANNLADATHIGGVILFDGDGRIISRQWALVTWQAPPGQARYPTGMGRLIFDLKQNNPLPDATLTSKPQFMRPGAPVAGGGVPTTDAHANAYMKSSLAFTLLDSEMFTGAGGDRPDYEASFTGSYTGMAGGRTMTEQAEETWIDQNALPFLVNRYNGTLTRGE